MELKCFFFQFFLTYLFIAEAFQSNNPINTDLMFSILTFCVAVFIELYLLNAVCLNAMLKVIILLNVLWSNEVKCNNMKLSAYDIVFTFILIYVIENVVRSQLNTCLINCSPIMVLICYMDSCH